MKSTSFAGLAQKTSRWTTNLLASGLVVVIVIGLGRQYLNWGRDDEPAPDARPASQASPLFDLPEGVTFGGSGGLRTERFSGTKQAAVARLLTHCRAIADDTKNDVGPATPAERRILVLTDKAEAVEVDPTSGRWRLYQFDVVFPFVAGVVNRSSNADETDARRLVAWGMAVPAGDELWSLFLWHGGEGDSDSSAATAEALPAGARRSLSLSSSDGGGVAAFHGEASPGQWMEFFDADLPRRGFARDGDWTYANGIWHARYRPDDGAAGSLVIQFTTTDDGRLRGLMTTSP